MRTMFMRCFQKKEDGNAVKPFLLSFFTLFLFCGNTPRNRREEMKNVTCLNEGNFELAADYLKKNPVSMDGWNLTYRNGNEINRIAFSKKKGWTLGFISNEKSSIEVMSLIKEADTSSKVEEEILDVFCTLIQKLKEQT